MKRIAITTGDPDGIGFEVTAKALSHIAPNKNIEYFVFATRFKSLRWRKLINRTHPTAKFVWREDSPNRWVKEAAEKCLAGQFHALVTGPMSKRPTGHTEILQAVAKQKRVYMTFLGSKFHVVLATGHIPLAHIKTHFRRDNLEHVIALTQALHSRLRLTKPIGLLALNPHAGERGQIGREEFLLSRLVHARQKNNPTIEGPLVPDAVFAPQNRSRYSIFIAQYHDQGLIPFKAIHGFSMGAHMTLGLPFIRTSVDHGTAKDIFNKGQADDRSMQLAIRWARRFIK